MTALYHLFHYNKINLPLFCASYMYFATQAGSPRLPPLHKMGISHILPLTIKWLMLIIVIYKSTSKINILNCINFITWRLHGSGGAVVLCISIMSNNYYHTILYTGYIVHTSWYVSSMNVIVKFVHANLRSLNKKILESLKID